MLTGTGVFQPEVVCDVGHLHQRSDDIALDCLNSVSADAEARSAEILHRPQDKAARHSGSLTGTDGAVTDQSVKIAVVPPAEYPALIV